jgi:hypothetical protein
MFDFNDTTKMRFLTVDAGYRMTDHELNDDIGQEKGKVD